jgi:hypothetical protein
MATIQQDILAEFYKRLENAEGFTAAIVQQIRSLFDGRKKPKAADIAKVLSISNDDTLK